MLKEGDEFLIIRKAVVLNIHKDKSICFNWKGCEFNEKENNWINPEHAIPLDSVEYRYGSNIGDKIFDDGKNEFIEINSKNKKYYIDGDYLVIKEPKVKLKKCPICKKTKSLKIKNNIHNYFIMCDENKSGCGLSSGVLKSKKDVIEKWNKR